MECVLVFVGRDKTLKRNRGNGIAETETESGN